MFLICFEKHLIINKCLYKFCYGGVYKNKFIKFKIYIFIKYFEKIPPPPPQLTHPRSVPGVKHLKYTHILAKAAQSTQ